MDTGVSVNTDVMFSSANIEWATPRDFFDVLNREFNFTLDVCATPENAKCAKFFTKEDNGLTKWWADDVCWMNPPYGNPEHPCKPNCQKKKCQERGYHIHEYIPGVSDWVRKAYTTWLYGGTVVCLLPARTDTEWFHRYIYKIAEVRFVKGRLKFGEGTSPAPFPSMVAIYRGSDGGKHC